MSPAPFDLARFPVHLGRGARVVRLPAFDGTGEWYARYGASVADDGRDGRLVSLHAFTAPWDTWEMRPSGEELVVCVQGEMTLHQEIDGEVHTAVLTRGQAIVNPAGVWHTADVAGEAIGLFVTAGMGTQIRPR